MTRTPEAFATLGPEVPAELVPDLVTAGFEVWSFGYDEDDPDDFTTLDTGDLWAFSPADPIGPPTVASWAPFRVAPPRPLPALVELRCACLCPCHNPMLQPLEPLEPHHPRTPRLCARAVDPVAGDCDNGCRTRRGVCDPFVSGLEAEARR